MTMFVDTNCVLQKSYENDHLNCAIDFKKYFHLNGEKYLNLPSLRMSVDVCNRQKFDLDNQEKFDEWFLLFSCNGDKDVL